MCEAIECPNIVELILCGYVVIYSSIHYTQLYRPLHLYVEAPIHLSIHDVSIQVYDVYLCVQKTYSVVCILSVMARERDQRGQYSDAISPEKALSVFEDRTDSAKPLTANDISNELGWSRRTVHNKLTELVDQELLKTRKIGARGRVWWVPMTGNFASQHSQNTSGSEDITTPEDVLEDVGTAIPGNSEEERIERADVVLQCYNFLKNNRKTTTKKLKEHAQRINPTDNTKTLTGAERQWVNYLRDSLAVLPNVEKPPRGGTGHWQYIPDDSDLLRELQIHDQYDWVKDLEPTGEGDSVDRQRAMVQMAYDYLKEHGSATKNDFKEALPEYTAHYSDFDGLWVYCIREELKDAPNVISPDQGNTWYFDGDGDLPDELDIDIDDWVHSLDEVTGEGRAFRERQALVQLSYNILKDQGEAMKRDFESELPEHTGGYIKFDSLWSYCISPSLKQAPNVRTSESDGPITYEYVGED